MSTITLDIPDCLMDQLRGRSETIESLLLKALEDYLQKESSDTTTGEPPNLMRSAGTLVPQQKHTALSLDVLLASIPDDFEYPEDVKGFTDSDPVGQEII
jgi:antitoxin MazE